MDIETTIPDKDFISFKSVELEFAHYKNICQTGRIGCHLIYKKFLFSLPYGGYFRFLHASWSAQIGFFSPKLV